MISQNLLSFFLIMIGGGVGSTARFFLGEWVNSQIKQNFANLSRLPLRQNAAQSQLASDSLKGFFGKFLAALQVNSLASFPWATFVVNLSGSMVAGFLYFFLIQNIGSSNQYLRHFLLVGFLGGFTTFSAFSLDFFRLFISGHHLQACIYGFVSVFLSILALFFGFYLAKFFTYLS